MTYRILQRNEFIAGDYKITPIRYEDRLDIMNWRNDQIEILRQKAPLTIQEQDRYFKEMVMPQLSSDMPAQILVSFFKSDKLIGYGGIVHISWENMRGEISFLLDTVRNKKVDQFQSDYSAYLGLIKQIAFRELGFNKITTEAFDLRPHLVETLEANGFVREGRLVRHNLIQGKYVDSLLHACFNTFS